jgi:hypothetical protein
MTKLATRRDEPVVCAKCGRKTKRRSRQQRYCSARCQNKARLRGKFTGRAQGSQVTWDRRNFANEIIGIRGGNQDRGS